jgi:glucose-6-phosphate 1-dehydrogenase
MSGGDPASARTLVLFGASGDLAWRKILPALYDLDLEGLLPDAFAVAGFAATAWDDAAFREHAREGVERFARRRLDERRWRTFAERLAHTQGGFEDAGAYARLRERLDALDRARGAAGRRLHYCATPPAAFATIARELARAGLQRDASIVLEKPIGRDAASARELQSVVGDVFAERDIFRIDHYLGKETVQNILVFRFANPMLSRIWNREAIDHMQITVAESLGIEGRGRYYENAGALRDMVQNHLLQVVTFLAMEPPAALTPEGVRDAKAQLLAAMRPLDPSEVVYGQYTWGVVDGREAAGYRDEAHVARDSRVETFVAARAWIDNDRWSGVPFLVRTGKRLPRRATEVTVGLRDGAESSLFAPLLAGQPADQITIRLQPDEGITVAFRAKEPGPAMAVRSVPMHFSYGAAFETAAAEAYERLLGDAVHGDQTLFLREDAVERAWEIVAPVLDLAHSCHPYPAGTWGPEAAEELIAPGAWQLR